MILVRFMIESRFGGSLDSQRLSCRNRSARARSLCISDNSIHKVSILIIEILKAHTRAGLDSIRRRIFSVFKNKYDAVGRC